MRVHNFAAGPATLPEPVLEQVQAELLDWGGRGYSVIESSHRIDAFVELMVETEALMRELLAVPAHYRVLFMQGGGHQQFAMVPLNLLRGRARADYLISGHWSDKAALEAERFCEVQIAANTLKEGQALRAPHSSE